MPGVPAEFSSAAQLQGRDINCIPAKSTTLLQGKDASACSSKDHSVSRLSEAPKSQGTQVVQVQDPALCVADNNDIAESTQSRIISQIESILESKLNVMKCQFIEELKSTIATEIKKELATISANLQRLEGSHNSLLNNHVNLQKDFDGLRKQVQESDCQISELRVQLNKQQQWVRMSNIEVIGLPETANESPSELIIKVAKHAGVILLAEQIESAHRVQPMQKVDGRPKPIVAKLRDRILKDQIISGLRKSRGIETRDIGMGGAVRRFYVNEHLTPENKNLLKKAKLRANEKSYKFVWVRNCNIFLRMNEASPVVYVQSERDLNYTKVWRDFWKTKVSAAGRLYGYS
ncbi:Zinc finger DNA binding protein, partial [Operophtera brumata]